MYKLSDIFKTNNIEQKRKILSNFLITREDRNKALVGSMHTSNGEGGGGILSKYAPRYFKIDLDKASEDWAYVLCVSNNGFTTIAATYRTKYTIEGNVFNVIAAYPFISTEHESYAFSYIPLFINQTMLDAYGIQAKGGIQTFEDIIKVASSYLSIIHNREISLSTDGITEITEDEYYKID